MEGEVHRDQREDPTERGPNFSGSNARPHAAKEDGLEGDEQPEQAEEKEETLLSVVESERERTRARFIAGSDSTGSRY